MPETCCEHTFSYLLKDHGRVHIGRVLELPGVIVSGTPEEVDTKIVKATRAYLKVSKNDHKKAKANQLKPILVTPKRGIIIRTKEFTVRCLKDGQTA